METFALCAFLLTASFISTAYKYALSNSKGIQPQRGGHGVVMATISIALTAKFLCLCASVQARQKLQREKGQSESELRSPWECPTDTLTNQRTPGRTNKTVLCPSISLIHLRPFHYGVHPIYLLPVSGDGRGGNKTAEKETRERTFWVGGWEMS